MNASAEPEKQSQYKPNLSLPKGDQTQPVVSLSNLFQKGQLRNAEITPARGGMPTADCRDTSLWQAGGLA